VEHNTVTAKAHRLASSCCRRASSSFRFAFRSRACKVIGAPAHLSHHK
jgi:hypothetical protein